MADIALADLEAFAAVARRRSFRQAARERGVSPSLLSQTVRRLEDRLGVQLLNRTTRSVSATQAGEILLAGLEPAFSGIAAALESLNGLRITPSGRLRINAPVPVVQLLLTSLVAEFLATHPGIELEITADNALVDVFEQGYDAGVRFGEDLAQDMIAVPLPGPCRRVVVAAPALLARAGVPAAPHELVGRSLIAHRFPRGAIYHWEFAKDGQALTIAPTGPLVTGEALLEVQAAVDGVGYAWVFEDYARPHLDAGRLVAVLEDWAAPMPAPFLYFSGRRHVPAALRAFVEFIRAR